VIWQGDIYWYDFGVPRESEPGYRRPAVVIQNDIANQSAIKTIMVCAITTNLRLSRAPGNVLLDPGEANLPQRSVINVSQVVTINKSDLADGAYIGTLSSARIDEVVAGVTVFLRPSQSSRRPRR
jgi:mRNA interferase MazF